MVPTNAELCRSARRLGYAADLLSALLVLLLASLIWQAGQRLGWREPQTYSSALASVLPGLCHLWALTRLGRIFSRIAAGETIVPALGHGLRQLGWAVVLAGTVSLVAPPALSVAANLFLSNERAQEITVEVNGAHIMLILMGVAVLLLARLFELATNYRSRSEALQAELDGFL